MGFFTRKNEKLDKLIEKREQLAKQVLPVMQEQVRNNPDDGGLHLELVKVLAMSGRLDEAKKECERAMLKFSDSLCGPARNLQAEIDRLIKEKRTGI